MDENELLARFGLVPIAADLAEVRRLIEALIAGDGRVSNEPLKTLCIQLFSAGNPADALLIYKAKGSSFDAECYIDIQLVCGAGLEPTKAFLCGSSEPKAKELLALLQNSSSAGDFDDFTPEKQLNFYRHYYGLPVVTQALAISGSGTKRACRPARLMPALGQSLRATARTICPEFHEYTP